MAQTNQKKTLAPVYVTTPPLRLAFPSLDKPRARAPGSPKMTYQAVLLIPPETDMAPFKAAVEAAMMEKFGKVIQVPREKLPIKLCADKSGIDGYEDGWRYINTHSGYAPKVVDHNRQPLIDIPSVIYPGCWCRFLIKAFAYSNEFGKGVSFSLEAVQFVRDGDRLDGRADVNDVFDPIESGDAPAAGKSSSDDSDIWG
jgi:hypothetical protein